jgi:toxin FitB
VRRFLLDTSVLSTFAPDKPPVPEKLAEWVQKSAETLFVPVIALAEIEQGIRKLHRAGGTARADRLSLWLEELVTRFGDRILAVDAAVARAGGALSDTAMAAGRHPGLADILIAATAEIHGLRLLMRNKRHFTLLGIDPVDPFEELPSIRGEP